MNARSLAFVVVLAICGSAVSSIHTVHAAEPSRTGIEFDRIDVPADQPSLWQKEIERFDDLPREDFLSLIEQIQARERTPRPASLKSAYYEATLVHDTLRGGTMTASVQRLEGRTALLELGKFSFALEELRWQDRSAIWGSSSDGRTWVLTGENHDELLGEWSYRGRKIPGGVDFDLQLPQATISFLDLRIPREYSVFAPAAEVTLLSDVEQEETRLWRIRCANDSRIRMTCVAREGIETGRRALIVEHDMQVVVREEDLRFQLNLYLEALDAPVQDLVIQVPTGLEIYSAIYGGENPVALRRPSEIDSDRRWSVHLPGPLSGRRRTLRIDGIAVQKPGQETVLPQVTVENSIFEGGHLNLTIQSPLEVRSIRPNGYVQRTSDGEQRFTFEQLTPNSQLILGVHKSPVSLSGQVLGLLSIEEEFWNLTSEIIWKSLKGGAYQTACLLPSEWEVTEVRLKSDAESRRGVRSADEALRSFDQPKMNWEVQAYDGQKSKLSIEFLDAIPAGQMRAVKIFARRRTLEIGQPVPIPLPQLLNCETSELTLGIQVPASMASVISPDSRLERIARPNLTSFDVPSEKPNTERRWYRGDTTDGSGTIRLTPRLAPVYVRTEMSIEALRAEYRVKYSIQSEKSLSQTDRLLVYLTEPNVDVRWAWKGFQSIELSAVRLSRSSHDEWNLPSEGELWDIRLPRNLRGEGTIEGTATNRWSVNNRPALIYIPQAVDKRVSLKVTNPENLELEHDTTDGLKADGKQMTWWYTTPQADFGLALRNPLPSREFPLMVSVELRTLLSTDADGSDLYRARLQLENGSAVESIRIKLDPIAVLQEARVGGELIAATIQAGEFVIPGLNAARRDLVEISYRVPAQATVLFERRRIVIPQVSAQVLGFFWEFGVPASARVFAEPSGVHMSGTLPQPSWTERLFGPLGRSAAERIFNPFRQDAWQKLVQPVSSTNDDSGDELIDLNHATAPNLPSNLEVELWHADRIHILAWISLGLCLLSGVVSRMLAWSQRDRLAAYALGLLLAITLSMSMPYCSFSGGAIGGLLISLLLPHQFLRKTNLIDQETVEFRRIPGAIIAMILGGVTYFGAASSIGTVCFAQESISDAAVLAKHPRVYVPVDKNGVPSETVRLVYVPHDALERWKAIANEYTSQPKYLISSARYELSGVMEPTLSLLAKFRVHVLHPTDESISVVLPFSEVILPSAESCQVNGRVYPISILPNGKGYTIDLTPQSNTRLENLPKESNRDPSEDDVTTYEIELHCRKPRPVSGKMDLNLPSIANTQLTFLTSESIPFAEISGGLGSVAHVTEAPSAIGQLGTTSRIEVRWGLIDPPPKPAKVSASLIQHLELSPAYAELIFHFVGTVEEGELDALEFELPPNAVLRKELVRADDLLRTDTIEMKNGERRYRLIFDKPRRGSVTVDGSFILQQTDSFTPIPLPKFGLASSNWCEFQYKRNWWGVSASTDFQLDHPNLDPENVITISSDDYLDAWKTAAESRRHEPLIKHQPQLVFELRDGTVPTFTLIPYHPKRRATQWKQAGYIGRNRLDWTLVGEIETSHTPTFQIALLVDRRLKIEEISVKENKAERLNNRWTESRGELSRGELSRVVLFLSSKAQGTQTITLRGSLPIVPGTPIILPTVRAEDCETMNPRLTLVHDPEVEVAFTLPPEWKPIALDDSLMSGFRTSSPVIKGSYQLNDFVAVGTIQTSARHSRCSSRAVARLKRSDDGANWRLNYRLEMTPEGDSAVRMGVAFPPSFSDVDAVTVSRAEPVWQHDLQDGTRQLDLLLNRSEGPTSVVVQFETTLAEPNQAEWELPLPVPLHSKAHETLIAIDPDTIWFPKTGREIGPGELAKWESDSGEEFPSLRTPFVVVGTTIEFQRTVAASEVREPSIRLLDQRMWLHRDGRRSGIAQMFVSSMRGDLELQVPDRVSITSIFLNDRALALSEAIVGLLKVPMIDVGVESVLTITWQDEEQDVGLRLSTSEPFLWPRNVPVERSLVAIVPDEPTTISAKSGLTPIGSLDRNLDVLETLLDRHSALGIDTRAAIANRCLIDQLQRQIKERLPKEFQRGQELVRKQFSRWSEFVGRINQLERVPDSPTISWYARLFEEPTIESEYSILGRTSRNATVSIRQFDWRAWKSVGAALLSLILVLMLRRTIRIEWSGWLNLHVAFSWLLLATFWWLCLTPSALGPCLLAIAMAKAVSQYRPAKSPA